MSKRIYVKYIVWFIVSIGIINYYFDYDDGDVLFLIWFIGDVRYIVIIVLFLRFLM